MSLAPTRGRAGPGLADRLFREPEQFAFFQAVRLLAHLGRRLGHAPPGEDVPARQEFVRFHAAPALSFPTSEVARLTSANGDPSATLNLTVSFLGLTGAAGVLPYHYTRLLLDRLRRKDSSYGDFLDLFHHRLTAFFARAWEKYRLPFAFERARLASDGPRTDPVTQVLCCLAGWGTDGLRGRLQVADGAFVWYGGHFGHSPRSALALEGMLGEYFEVPVEVRQLRGQWLYLEPDDCSQMPSSAAPDGRNRGLGGGLIAGSRVWDVQSRFRLRVGPLDYATFARLLPVGDMLRPVAELTRAYVGPELDFDVQLVLKAEEVPWCVLGEEARLGWNTWVRCEAFGRDVDDPVFLIEDGAPSI